MNKGFSLKMKLVLLCGFLLSISAGVGGISYYTLGNVSYNYDFVIEKAVPKTKLSYEMMLSYRRLRIQTRTRGIQGLSPKAAEDTIKEMHVSMAQYEKLNSEYLDLGFIPGQKELYDKVQAAWLDFKSLGEQVISLDKSGRPEDKEKIVQIFLNDCPKKALTYTAAVESLIQFHQNVLDNRASEAKAAAGAGNNLNILVILLGVACGLGIGFLIATKISRAVAQVSKDLAMGSEQVAAASTQIASSSQSLSEAASEQAASLEETVATMEELTSMVRLNTENGKQAANLSVSTRDVALKGEMEIKKLIDSIYSISSDSKKIEEITTVIDDIAFQTNLLALNAAVEAARAGEQGKGFAVVADAVRTLAQKSAEAAKDIADLIKGSVEKIEVGSQQANQGGVVLAEIVSAVKKVADLNNEIASASEEQSNGITQIGKAMNQMDQVTQQNAAAAEETAASAEELSAQAESLKTNVASLETLVYGTTQTSASGAPGKPATSSKSNSNVVQFKKAGSKAQTSTPASKAIPFDEDELVEHRKVGTTDGF